MRTYEVIYIVHPDLDEPSFKQINDHMQSAIKDNGGKVNKADIWGKRKLAYPIRKQRDGQYVLLHTEMEPAFCTELERQLRLQEAVMRFLIIATDEDQE
jgi:small subunit ribosomal protein S6